MKLAATLLPAALVSFLPAQDAWDTFAARHRGAENDQWMLCLRAEDAQRTPVTQEDVFLRLRASIEFSVFPLEPPVAQALWAQKEWKTEPHWLLLAPDGSTAAEGRGIPQGPEIMEAMKASGFKPRWERRAAFLKEHPGHGDAWIEAFDEGMRLARYRVQALRKAGKARPMYLKEANGQPLWEKSTTITQCPFQGEDTEAQADEAFREACEALEKLSSLPYPLALANRSIYLSFFNMTHWGSSQSPRFQNGLHRLRATLDQALRRDPHNKTIQDTLGNLYGPLDDLPDPSGFAPLPDRFWPDASFIQSCVFPIWDNIRGEGNAVLELAQSYEANLDPASIPPQAWNEFCEARGMLCTFKAMALTGLGRWEEAKEAWEASRTWAGSHWTDAKMTSEDAQGILAAFGIPPEHRAPFLAILQAPALPDPPRPASRELRLVLEGQPAWAPAWTALAHAKPLSFWAPDELRWEQRPSDVPGWGLYRGSSLVYRAQALPAAPALAARLAAEAPSRLQRLDALLANHPDHLGARRARALEALPRMPNGELEPQLAEDAARAWLVLDFGPDAPWKPDPVIWQWQARRVLPQLEDTLRTWPAQVDLWRAWLAWAPFAKPDPSPLPLLESLAIWGEKSNWEAALPEELHRAVAAAYRRRGDFQGMRQWFQEAWRGLDKRPSDQFPEAERASLTEIRRKRDTIIFQGYREALTALRLDADLLDLEQSWAAMTQSANPKETAHVVR